MLSYKCADDLIFLRQSLMDHTVTLLPLLLFKVKCEGVYPSIIITNCSIADYSLIIG